MGRNEQKQSATLPLKIPELKNDKAYVKLFGNSWQISLHSYYKLILNF